MLEGTFIEALHGSKRLSIRAYWGNHKTATLKELVRYATCFKNLQSPSASPANTLSPTRAHGNLGHRRDRSNRNVMMTFSEAKCTMNNSLTNMDQVMASNSSSTATHSGPTKATTTSTPFPWKRAIASLFAFTLIIAWRCAWNCPHMSARSWWTNRSKQ